MRRSLTARLNVGPRESYFFSVAIPHWWGRGDSNSHALQHMILNHARLPIPTLPRKYGALTIPAQLVTRPGIEPGTYGLRVRCSAS